MLTTWENFSSSGKDTRQWNFSPSSQILDTLKHESIHKTKGLLKGNFPGITHKRNKILVACVQSLTWL
ncbi:hypothetical protein TNCT_617251 [Trichonephila clavata]|uniref:Uncharacterized protein n=1 Tax=Trichonephila clavata TaxID=2740835 RepID=A0A8X6FTS4_TRICU|nr:hypothetical protein TNCT_617251 [Trichonephila clavata]